MISLMRGKARKCSIKISIIVISLLSVSNLFAFLIPLPERIKNLDKPRQSFLSPAQYTIISGKSTNFANFTEFCNLLKSEKYSKALSLLTKSTSRYNQINTMLLYYYLGQNNNASEQYNEWLKGVPIAEAVQVIDYFLMKPELGLKDFVSGNISSVKQSHVLVKYALFVNALHDEKIRYAKVILQQLIDTEVQNNIELLSRLKMMIAIYTGHCIKKEDCQNSIVKLSTATVAKGNVEKEFLLEDLSNESSEKSSLKHYVDFLFQHNRLKKLVKLQNKLSHVETIDNEYILKRINILRNNKDQNRYKVTIDYRKYLLKAEP